MPYESEVLVFDFDPELKYLGGTRMDKTQDEMVEIVFEARENPQAMISNYTISFKAYFQDMKIYSQSFELLNMQTFLY